MSKNATSFVWKYYTKLDNYEAKCNHCNKRLKTGGGTSNLIHHLRFKHHDLMGFGNEPGLQVIKKENSGWAPDHVSALIQAVKERPVIYDSSHPLHKRRNVRQKSLQEVAEIMHKIRPNTTPDEIQRKWTGLKYSFTNHFLKEEASKKSNTTEVIYQPNLHYYQEMQFFKDFIEMRPDETNDTKNTSLQSIVVDCVMDETPSSPPEVSASKTFSNFKFNKPEKSNIDNGDLATILKTTATTLQSMSQFVDDDLDRYGKTVADRLRKCNELDQVVIKKKIDDLFFDTYVANNSEHFTVPNS